MVIVTFCSADKKFYKIEIPQGTTVEQAKKIYEEEVGCKTCSIRMIFKKKVLQNNIVIDTLDIKENDFIVVYVLKKGPPLQKPILTSPSNSSSQAVNVSELNAIQNTSQIPSQSSNQTNINYPNSNTLPYFSPNQPNTSIPRPSPLPVSISMPYNQNQFQPFSNNQSSSSFQFPSPAPSNPNIFQSNYDYMNDPKFYQKIDYLRELGCFGRSECEDALRAAFGNVEHAAEYLLSGHIPDIQSQRSNSSQSIQLNQEFITTFRQMLITEPRLLENFIEEFEIKNPRLRQNPEELLSQFGLSVDGFDIEGIRNRAVERVDPDYFDQLMQQTRSQVSCPELMGCIDEYEEKRRERKEEEKRNEDSMLSQFSDEEKSEIRRIQSLGSFILNEVIQIYLACDKNEQLAANLLLSHK
ncbi:hypothetical protein M9Y10_019584 [Tritrichomonas musculus]|uniref:UV excision repair protein RAD23 n=1 Tax=Tritrichomonas musculus TaxID=1915356 RepID=A0ABR2HJ07_9EUKA